MKIRARDTNDFLVNHFIHENHLSAYYPAVTAPLPWIAPPPSVSTRTPNVKARRSLTHSSSNLCLMIEIFKNHVSHFGKLLPVIYSPPKTICMTSGNIPKANALLVDGNSAPTTSRTTQTWTTLAWSRQGTLKVGTSRWTAIPFGPRQATRRLGTSNWQAVRRIAC